MATTCTNDGRGYDIKPSAPSQRCRTLRSSRPFRWTCPHSKDKASSLPDGQQHCSQLDSCNVRAISSYQTCVSNRVGGIQTPNWLKPPSGSLYPVTSTRPMQQPDRPLATTPSLQNGETVLFSFKNLRRMAEIPAMDCHYRRAPHRKVSSTPLVLSAGKMWISRKRTSTPFPNSRATSSC